MKSSRVEFLFLKTSIDQFVKDLKRFSQILESKDFSDDEELEVMSYLVAVKENIEAMEVRYSRPQ
jgi:hypothetical protein